MANDEKELWARLKFAVDEQNLDKAKKATDDLTKGLEKTKKSAEEAAKSFARIRETAERVRATGLQVAAAGGAIVAPLALAARAYIQQAGEAESTSRRWNKAMQDIQQSQINVGRVAAQQILPYLEKAADLAEKIAQYAEDHPDVVKAALGIGGSLVVIGGLVGAVGQIGLFIGGIGQIAAALGAVGGAGMTTTLATLAGTLGPLAIALAGLTALLKSEFGKRGTQGGRAAAVDGGGRLRHAVRRARSGRQVVSGRGGSAGRAGG